MTAANPSPQGHASAVEEPAVDYQLDHRVPRTSSSSTEDGSTSPDKTKPMNKERHLLTGCYELLHFGHLNALRQVKQCYTNSQSSTSSSSSSRDVHVVAGIHPNEEILRVKGGVCILDEKEKERLLLGCKFVDEVAHNVRYDTIQPEEFNCDYCWHGDDAVVVQGTDIFGYAKNTEKFKTLRRTEGISTTLMIARFFTNQEREGGFSGSNSPSKTTRGAGGGAAPSPSPALSEEEETLMEMSCLGENLAEKILSKQDKTEIQYINATASRISRFFLPNRPRSVCKSVVYLQGCFDLFHVGYLDLLQLILETERKRKNLESVKDVFLIIGVLHHTTTSTTTHNSDVDNDGDHHVKTQFCLQSLHERAISMLSLRCVDDVVLDVQNKVDETFRRSLGITTVYGIENHCDFVNDERNASCVDAWVDGFGYFSSRTIQLRVLKSRKVLKERQAKKKEPEMAVAGSINMIDSGA
ncbi:unnamed protein product [Amoebophrya sp. A120]|nr:unnamed protein product [Amoebophrya sp. A120]|eukprot:GSA120T00008397001.1